jgi:hypothetical protein
MRMRKILLKCNKCGKITSYSEHWREDIEKNGALHLGCNGEYIEV